MEITCGERAIVLTTGHNHPVAAFKQERFLVKFLEFRGFQTGKIFSEIFGISVAQLSVWTSYHHRPNGTQFYQARR
jgi:hypothetical protein